MRLKELIENLDYERLENFSNYEIKGMSCNSERIRPGYLFVAIKGERFDGHSFLKAAINKGAGAVILQKDLPLKKKIAKILVSDSQAALSSASAAFFGYPAKILKTTGITGTNGKTTISYLIEKILGCAGKTCGVIGTVNYRIGNKVYEGPNPAIVRKGWVNTTPQVDILQSFLQEIVLAKSKYAIIEVSSHALAQRRVDGVDFSTAVFTNLSHEHLDYHGTLSNYFSCKASLFERLAPRAWAIVNVDDVWGRKLLKATKAKVLSYGIKHSAQIYAKDLDLEIDRSRFTVVTPRGHIAIESPLIGRHNVYNILAAVACAFVEDINFSHIISGVKTLSCVPGRLQRVDCGQSFLIFIDYAHTDDALSKVLNSLRQISENKIILVFGCGGDRDKAKRPKMGKVATELSDLAIITCDNPRSENPRQIIDDVVRGIDKKKNNYKIVLDRFKAIREALSCADKNDTVLITGKGHESSQIFANRTIHFNDRETVEKILQCLQSKRY